MINRYDEEMTAHNLLARVRDILERTGVLDRLVAQLHKQHDPQVEPATIAAISSMVVPMPAARRARARSMDVLGNAASDMTMISGDPSDQAVLVVEQATEQLGADVVYACRLRLCSGQSQAKGPAARCLATRRSTKRCVKCVSRKAEQAFRKAPIVRSLIGGSRSCQDLPPRASRPKRATRRSKQI